MQLVRFTYGPDIAKHGESPVLVEDVEARVLTADRRAVRVTEDELAEMTKADLVEVAHDLGIEAKGRKADIAAAVADTSLDPK